MKKLFILLTLLTLALCITACGNKDAGLSEESYTIEIEIENYGVITAVLDAKTAPITVKNLIDLINKDFYDGVSFHRIINGFMMQGGDPNGNGINDENTPTIKGEFAYNGVENNISHTRGTLSMARSSSYNSAASQFFIMHKDNTRLDGQYAAFGRVTDGMDIVDKICQTTPVTDDNGSVAPQNRPIIKEIRIVD
ncbi:MAG: peptidylprolyl isomerase [Clostridia bacterium]|nr:peptidylprolyl isomerase [Clostridia bacterium]